VVVVAEELENGIAPGMGNGTEIREKQVEANRLSLFAAEE